MSILSGVKPVYYEGGQNGLYVGATKILPGERSDIVS